MNTRFVCILATSRTGSSHLIELLRHCPELNVKGELFHVDNIRHLTKSDKAVLQEASNGEAADPKSLCEWRRKYPRQTLDLLYESGNRRPLVFKLFWDHLPKKIVADEIFGCPDIGFILLRRRPIDSYISRLKAAVATQHAGINTTTIRPQLEPKPFIFWARLVKDWYEWLDEEIRTRALPCFPLSYEQHIDNRTASQTLSEVFGRLDALGCPRRAIPARHEGRVRQDHESDYRKRVANWPAFESELGAHEPDLLRWALNVA
jgi:hypothetical protein